MSARMLQFAITFLVLAIVTGSGLKDIPAAIDSVGNAPVIRPDLAELRRMQF